jgi:hypothetical protein
MTEQGFRDLTDNERQLLENLLEVEFPDREPLRAQFKQARVQQRDKDFRLAFDIPGDAPLLARSAGVILEGELRDSDASLIHFVLHVRNGRASHLEFFKFEPEQQVIGPLNPDSVVVVWYMRWG